MDIQSRKSEQLTLRQGMQKDAMTKLNDALQEPLEEKERGNDEVSKGDDERHLG